MTVEAKFLSSKTLMK